MHCCRATMISLIALVVLDCKAARADDAKINTPVRTAELKGTWQLHPTDPKAFKQTLHLGPGLTGHWQQSEPTHPVTLAWFNVGFGGRMFLIQTEWLTYLLRMPVRYIRRPRREHCQVCGLPAGDQNPLQSAHVIGFNVGVGDLALTPEYLDGAENIVTAHRRICNQGSELGLRAAMARLQSLGVQELPSFLPVSTLKAWRRPDA